MDPALEEAIRREPSDREIEAVALVVAGAALPPDFRVVASFGTELVTGRVRVGRVADVRRHPAIRSLKAARVVGPADDWSEAGRVEPEPYSRGVAGAAGKGCLLAFLDWGCDFAHPNLLAAEGRTRLRAIWDQRGPGDGNRWGYGRIFTQERIDAALRQPDPYAALGYGPGRAGAHGTHVMDIAAGGGRLPGSMRGVAPEAELTFVHLATRLQTGDGDLGDSVRILEAIDFVREVAGGDPLVVNLSLGRTAGDHTGRSCVERGMDAFLEEAPGRAIVQSAGNYFGKHLHAAGVLGPGQWQELEWIVEPGDPTPNELELWYPGFDRLSVELAAPGDLARVLLELGQRGPVEVAGDVVGFAYHRERDPLNGDHHLDIFLEPGAPAGSWTVRLIGADVVDGRWHAWIERDPGGAAAQSRFRPDVATDDATIGSIATGHRTLVVGAIDPASGLPAPFSSRGPSRDGRGKPDLVAPGVGILAARSTPPGAQPGSGGLLELSGTSMASPHVAGAAAVLMGEAPRPLNIAETRLLLLGSARRLEGDPMRTGAGQLDTEAALEALRTMFRERAGGQSQASSGAGPVVAWSEAGTAELERELESALGHPQDYDVVGLPGLALEPVQAGDILVRFAPGRSRVPLVALLTTADRKGPEGASPGAQTEAHGDGWYAETVERTRDGWAPTPAYRRLANNARVGDPDQLVLRPVAGTSWLSGDDSAEDDRDAAVISPFPHPVSMPREMTNQAFIDCIEAAARPAELRGLCAAVVDLTGDPALPPYAGHNDTDILYVGSLAKLYPLYVAFVLRARVSAHARSVVQGGLAPGAPGFVDRVFSDLRKAWQPQLDRAFPRLPRGFPALERILTLSPDDGTARFTQDDPPHADHEIFAAGAHGRPPGKFLEAMKAMLGMSNDVGASRVIGLLSYPYINGVLASAGFFDPVQKVGLWISGDYRGNDWLPADGAGQLLTPRWAMPGHRVSNFAGTALQVTRLLGLMAQGALVDSGASAEMIALLGTPFLRGALLSASPQRPSSQIDGKVGIGTWDGRLSDGAVVRVDRGGAAPVRYALAVLGAPSDISVLNRLEIALHDCVVTRHGPPAGG
ncbi:MAG TPA: S8 family serine peptidase [Gemmatimonadales bacterium]|nr:S8 family serine peptidase [Gemmatimonadales bacterium]